MTNADKKAVELLHENSLRILSELGMEFHSTEALEILRGAGVLVDGRRAYFKPSQVEDALKQTARSFTLRARNSEYDTLISTEAQSITPGYGSSYISELDGSMHKSLLEDFLKLSDIVQQSAAFTINGGILAQPCELSADIAAIAMIYALLLRTDKALMGVSSDFALSGRILEMLKMVYGGSDLRENCRILTMISTMSPLSIDKNALDTMLQFAKAGQPIVIAPGPMAGGTGPVSLAGNISMANAEILATNVLLQAASPGSPMVYGFAATTSDMRDMQVSNASAGFLKQAKFGALLAKSYGLPCRSGGGMSDAGGLTAQAGVESALGLFHSFRNGANLIMHATGSLHSFNSVNYEKFMLDIETAERLRYYLEPLDTDDDALAFDAISDVVKTGTQFMLHEHTFRRCRTDPWQPSVSLHGTARGEPNEELYASLRANLEKHLAAYERPALGAHIEKQLDNYVLALGLRPEAVERIHR